MSTKFKNIYPWRLLVLDKTKHIPPLNAAKNLDRTHRTAI